MRTILTAGFCVLVSYGLCAAADGNRFAFLRENNPWYPHTDFPKLTTPQWVGDAGVEAVVVLAIDDMRDTARYESYLRPILQRLKQIDGRAPVSIMTCRVKPDDPQLQSWLEEGLSIEVHTVDHPCPLLHGGDFERAKSTYDRCVDLLSEIPNNKPVAFRMPCCDSLNTVSPRFFAEIFNTTTESGRFLSISSSVFNVFTADDATIPRDLIRDANGGERFRKYFPKGLKRGNVEHTHFVNWIENYPYPYVVYGDDDDPGRCWEFPCVVPSDWEAQYLQQPNNPRTVEDMKAALDITVHKQGVFNLVFHPHGWIKADQVIEIIDHAVEKHGKKVKFLTFREALDRLNENLLDGESMRSDDGRDGGVRLLDVNNDGYQDVVIGTEKRRLTRIWSPRGRSWKEAGLPVRLGYGTQFTAVREDGRVSLLSPTLEGPVNGSSVVQESSPERAWYFDGREWRKDDFLQSLIEFSRATRFTPLERDDAAGPVRTRGIRDWVFRDIDHDGRCEAIVAWQEWLEDAIEFDGQQLHGAKPLRRENVNVFRSGYARPPSRNPAGEELELTWKRLQFAWPSGSLTPQAGVSPLEFRFHDFDGDGYDDLFASTHHGTTVALFEDFDLNGGWTRPVLNVDRENEKALPSTYGKAGTDNGFFIHSGNLCWQNEDTDHLPDLIHRIPIDELVADRLTFEQAQKPDVPLVLIGASTVDITPDEPVRLAGYASRTEVTNDVSHPIHAKALVFGGDYQSLESHWRRHFMDDHVRTDGEFVTPDLTVMLCVDNCGVPASLTEKLFAALQKRWGLKRERFVVSSTHTHSAPWLREFAPLQFPDIPEEHLAAAKRYEDELFRKLQAVAAEAITRRRLGRLAWGHGEVSFARNRRSLQDGKWVGFGDVPDGPVDHRLPILVGLDTSNRPMAVLANYACHCTTLTGNSNQVSGDWATVAADSIQERWQKCVAMVSIGAGADANPQPRGTQELAKQHGLAVADEVNRLLQSLSPRFNPDGTGLIDGSLKLIDPRAICRLEYVDLPLGPIPTRAQFEADANTSGSQAARAQKFLNMLDRGETIPTVVPDYPVSVWSFGDDLAMVFLGGEVVVDYALRMADGFDSKRLWLTAYSNAMPCYIPSKRILREGGYEADSSMRYYAQPTRLAPETEDIIIDTVQKLVPSQFYSDTTQTDFPPPKSPEESAAAIQMRPGLRVELVAAEPLIRDPVAFDWDISGRLWVVEMGDYPNGGETAGRIRVLEDTDGDGRYDTAETFLDGIGFPTGIHRWRNGIIVTAAPEIFYAEDSDGDGKADIRKTLYRGFVEGNQQHRVNGLRYGLDNWLYIANGDSGGEIESVDRLANVHGDEFKPSRVSLRGRDLRIRPDTGEMDLQSGQSQFGRCRDDWGNWFGCNNSRPIWQYVLADHYLRRNPHLPVRDTRHEVSVTPGAAPVFPISRTLTRFNDFGKANRFTSACSTTIYRDRLLGDQFYGSAFVCEPVHNLVSRLVLKRDGVTFTGRRAEDEQQSEFLASSDNWFRPVMVRTGPDGALWVADMYRFVIEHPKWIPAEWQRRLDLRAGHNMGRIYRIVPEVPCCSADVSPEDASVGRGWLSGDWKSVPAERLVQRLRSSNGWWRDAAQRILSHRRDRSIRGTLEVLAATDDKPLARLHALCTLHGMAAQDPQDVIHPALDDQHAGVRRHAIRLLEPFMRGFDCRPALMKRVEDEPQVQMQLAYSLGRMELVSDHDSTRMLAELAARHESDRWMQAAVTSSLQKHGTGLFVAMLNDRQASPNLISGYLNQAAAFDDVVNVVSHLTHLVPESARQATTADWQRLATVTSAVSGHKAVRKALAESAEWQALTTNAATMAAERESDLPARLAALQILRSVDTLTDKTLAGIEALLDPRSPSELQLAAVDLISNSGRSDVSERLLSGWPSHSPRVRTAVVDALLQSDGLRATLLDALKAETVATADLDASRREVLMTSGPAELQRRAKALLTSGTNSSRVEIIEKHRPALSLEASVERGQVVFQKRCSACHRMKDIGKSIGADLSALRDRSSETLLTAILDPNRAVEAKFLTYTAVTEAGRSFSGMLLSEAGNSLTLIGPDGKEQAILRIELETLVATGRSLMPEGLEKDLSQQDLADVIAFVQQTGTPSKRFSGNTPVTVRPGESGIITLPATAAAIYGPSLVFEAKYKNLGFWHDKDDYAVWNIELPASGTYDVEIDCACDSATAGNVLLLSTAGRELRGSIPGTGTWDDYRIWKPGRIDLRRGLNRLTVACPNPRGYVIDLRTIRLKPVP